MSSQISASPLVWRVQKLDAYDANSYFLQSALYTAKRPFAPLDDNNRLNQLGQWYVSLRTLLISHSNPRKA
jgi:hypothetical protein